MAGRAVNPEVSSEPSRDRKRRRRYALPAQSKSGLFISGSSLLCHTCGSWSHKHLPGLRWPAPIRWAKGGWESGSRTAPRGRVNGSRP